MRKIALITLFIMLVTMCFTGCGDKNSSSVKEVVIWTNQSHSKSAFTDLVMNFNETLGKAKGIKVVYEVKEGDIGAGVEVALASNTAPDIFTGVALNKADDGVIMAIEDCEGGNEILNKYAESFGYVGKWKGKTYTLPYSVTPRGLIYNKDMFKKAGIVDENGEAKPPVTWAEVREYAKKLTDTEAKEYGICFPLKWSTWFVSDILSPGSASNGLVTGYDPVSGTYDYAPYKPMMETIMGIKEDGSYFPGAEGLDNDPARARFADGKIGMKFGFSWDVGVLNDQFPASCEWGVAPYPVLDENDKYQQIMSVNALYYMNKKNADEQDKAAEIFEVFKWLHSDEVITALYNNCFDLPPMTSQIKEETGEVQKTGWKEFCDLLDISFAQIPTMPSDMAGKESLKDLFINKVWTGEMSIDEAVETANKNMNEGIDEYFRLNTEDSKDSYIMKDWNIKR